MASPHVAGAAAVLFGAGAGSAEEVEHYLKSYADSASDSKRFGAGKLNLAASVRGLIFWRNGILSLSGGLCGLAFGLLAGRGSIGRWVTTLLSAMVAGGIFFLPLLPVPPSAWVELLSKPLLQWPGNFWMGFPLWQSCLIPLVSALLLSPSRRLGVLALALCAGIGSYQIYGAVLGGDLWWLPFGMDQTWLMINGSLSLLFGLAAAGMQRMILGAK